MEPSSTFPSSHQNQVFQGFSWVGCVHLSALDILIAVSTLECSAGPRPGWLQGPAVCCCFRYAAGAEQSPGTAGFEAQGHVITGDLLVGRQSPVQLAENLSVTWALVRSTGPQPNWLEPSGMQLVQEQVVGEAPGTAGYEAWQHANTTSTPVGGTNPSTDTLEGGLQNDTHQHLYAHGRIWWQNGYL